MHSCAESHAQRVQLMLVLPSSLECDLCKSCVLFEFAVVCPNGASTAIVVQVDLCVRCVTL